MKTARDKKPDAHNNNRLTSEQAATIIDEIEKMISKGLTQCASAEELSRYKDLASFLLRNQQKIIYFFTRYKHLLEGQNRDVLEIINTYANGYPKNVVEQIEKGVDALRSYSNASHSFFRASQDERDMSQDERDMLRNLEELAKLYILIEKNGETLLNFISMVGNDRGGPKI